ncbi:hypothetical protein GGP77_001615 [Salinibacter ruber]|uniref:hypothetical protein n=1 Tax=Salinibacter ruber TaxID=146919 RepID=UPI00216A09B2|nr:hypothetical protein [Salinibacter ruber]MCS3667386.1 hypothetical protein [Salinibacter ruber]
MILRDCDTCQRRTDHDRRQWAKAEDGAVTIRTEYTCTACGTVNITYNEFPTHEREANRT